MGSNADENRKYPWDAVIRELIAKGEVSENVLHDSDTIIRWWRSLDPAKQEEIKSRVEELSQGGESDTPSVYTLIEEEPDNKVSEEPSVKRTATPSAHRSRKAPIILLSLALLASIVYCFVITGDRNTLNEEVEAVKNTLSSTRTQLLQTVGDLSSTKQSLVSTQSELSSTQQTLASTQSELTSTKADLASSQLELGSTKKTLTVTQSELTSTKSELDLTEVDLSSTKQSLVSTQSELSSTQQQLAVAQETLEGLGITLYTSKERYDVALIDNPTATNPTWSQLMTFIRQDQTDKNYYVEDVYDCTEYSRDVHNNAEAVGIHAATVHIDFENERVSHALNAFLTTDYGLVYVDCTKIDTIARIKKGKELRAVELDQITGTNVRNDGWWDTLSLYYYHKRSSVLSLRVMGSVTSRITIYW